MCIGANLARGEAVEVIEQLLARFPDIELDDAKEPPVMHGHMPRSFRPLHARWTPREA
jgi:cytochrome P450